MNATDLARDLRRLADKAINRAAFGVGMTELMPEDVRLLQRAATALDAADKLAGNDFTFTCGTAYIDAQALRDAIGAQS